MTNEWKLDTFTQFDIFNLPKSCLQRNRTALNRTVSHLCVNGRFLMLVVQLIVSQLSGQSFHWLSATSTSTESTLSCDFLCQELSHLLLYVTHMFQSGKEFVSLTLISVTYNSQHLLSVILGTTYILWFRT